MIRKNSQLSLFWIVISTISLSACGDKYTKALEEVTLYSYNERVCRLNNDIQETYENDKCDDVNAAIAYQEAIVLGIDKDRVTAATELGISKADADNANLKLIYSAPNSEQHNNY